MLQQEMVLETVEIMKRALDQGREAFVFVNNRAGGNAPWLARKIAEKFLGKKGSKPPRQLDLWET